jgi:hypothetical protein
MVSKARRLSYKLQDLGWLGPTTLSYPTRAFEYIILAFAKSAWRSKREPKDQIVFSARI